MNRFALALVLCGLAASAVPAAAQTPQQQQVYTAPTPGPLQYTDPAMTFNAPPGWVKANMPPHNPQKFDQPTVVAAFFGGTAQHPLQITITMENIDPSNDPRSALSGYEMVTENTMRNQVDGVFIKKSGIVQLSNGMPAYWQDITLGNGFNTAKRYQYVWVDGVRGVQLAVTARLGDITEAQAKQILSGASAVVYPIDRY